jgi:hypothetical protein
MSSTERTPRARALRFGGGAFVLLGAFAALLWIRKHQAGWSLGVGGLGSALLLLALVTPAGALAVRAAWMRFAGLIGWFNSRVLLTVLFFVVLTPLALARRLFGASPLSTDWKPGATRSFWKKTEKSTWERPY